MNKKILLAEVFLALFITLGFKLASERKDTRLAPLKENTYRGRQMMGCSPDWQLLNLDSLGATMLPLPGWGTYEWRISSLSDSARFYFNQGINMYYAFHIIEAMASFKKAQQFDDKNPMIYWAQALAFGPNINDFAYAAVPDAIAAAEKASELSVSATRKEQALIGAMRIRYSSDTTISRKELNQQYSDRMKAVHTEFGADADAATLYADALMLQHPWEYWQHNGNPHPWTPEIVAVLESVLKRTPGHPGANHYYIHMLEASTNPGKALPSADRLLTMMPAVSHMVHMPSHIYIRTGHYAKGILANERSLSGYATYKTLYPDVGNNAFLYAIHNYHMEAACAMMQPNYLKSFVAATECASSFDSSYLSLPHPLGNAIQYIYLTPQMVNVRYGKWAEVLAAPKIHSNYAFGFLLDQWARGMAYAHSGRVDAAREALKLVETTLQDSSLRIRFEPFNVPYDQATVASMILQGTIAKQEKNLSQAISIFSDAVVAEDKLIYTEPRDWLIPTRHYLATALIKDKQHKKAAAVLMEDLKTNPANFYALRGMQMLAQSEKNTQKLSQYTRQLKAAYQHSDLRHAALLYE